MSSSTARGLKFEAASNMQSQQAVQSFTRKWSTDNIDSPLAQGLVAFTDQQLQNENYVLLWDEKDSLSHDKPITRLDKELYNMTAQWKKFQDELPSNERATRDSGPPSFTSVVAAIDYWTNKCKYAEQNEHASVKANFQEFCITMDAHSQLFSIFPNGDKYVSLLSGTISSIVKASVNHAKICEGFSGALVTIGSEIKFWKETIHLHCEGMGDPVGYHSEKPSSQAGNSETIPKYKNEHIIEIVTRLYTKVFNFLANMMEKWMKSRGKRIINSFDQKFYSKYIEQPMGELKELSGNLQREALTLHQWDVKRILSEARDNRKNSENNYQKLYEQNSTNQEEVIRKMKLIDDKLNKRAERENTRLQGVYDTVVEMAMVLEKVKEQLAQVGVNAYGLLNEPIVFGDARQLEYSPEKDTTKDMLLIPQSTRKSSRTRQLSPSASTNIIMTYTYGYIERATRNLEPYSHNNFPISQLNNPRNQLTSNNIFQRVQVWLTGAESCVLFIYGPAQTPRPSMTAFAATHVVRTLEKANVPIISYYCDADKAKADPLNELVTLVYSLIRQLVWHVPEEFSNKIDFSEQRFTLLNGKPESLKEALSLFSDLIAVVPRLLFCVIAGINMLELDNQESDDEATDNEEENKNRVKHSDTSTVKYITRLLAILKKYKKTKVLKGLIVTDGFSSNLFQDRCFDNLVNAMATARFTSGKNRARRPLNNLRYSDVGSSAAETEESDS